jgi:hypothetical protein
MHSDDTVIHFALVAIPLSSHAHRVLAALANPRLVHHPDRVGMSVVLGDDLLASIPERFFIPLDRFEKTL